MRVTSTYRDAPVHEEQRRRVHTRFRFALGGLASQVKTLRVQFEETRGEHLCTATLTLADGCELVIESSGGSFEDVLGFVARRAASAVSLRVSTNRLLGT